MLFRSPTSASWNNGASSPARTASPGFPSSSSLNQFDFSSGSGTTSTHARRASRHNRRSSVSNFRESLEIVSGQGNYQGNLQTATSSFAPPVDMAPTSPSMSADGHSPTWSNDPAKVLEALKERGRRESETEDPMRTRLGALEALEGRLAAPSEMIDLGNQTEGSLLVAPPSPGFTGPLGRERRSSHERWRPVAVPRVARFVRFAFSCSGGIGLMRFYSVLYAQGSRLLVKVGWRGGAPAATAVRGGQGVPAQHHLLRRD